MYDTGDKSLIGHTFFLCFCFDLRKVLRRNTDIDIFGFTGGFEECFHK
jgi:hypothetical protein